MDAYQTIVRHRAVRHFTVEPLPEPVLLRILQAGRWAGSSKNTQNWYFIVVRDRQTLNQLAECGRYASHLRTAALAVAIATEPGQWNAFDAGRAAQNMMLAAWADGVGSCIASMHDEACARRVLGTPENLLVLLAISFGYPMPDAPKTIEGQPRDRVLARVGRKPLDEIVHRDKW